MKRDWNSPANRRYLILAVICLAALVSRIWAGVVFPNPEQDGYSYAEIASRLTDHLRAGTFNVSDLYGFWLPLFQITTALLNLGIHDPIIAGKIINVVCGALSVVIVFELTMTFTGSVLLSLFTFAVLLIDPFHLLYSAACMTDVPHACLVLASLWLVVKRRWLGAAILGLLAECMRVESWALIIGLPLLQLLLERRISPWMIIILLVAPLGWLVITYATTGNPLDYFQDRAHYHAEYLQFHRAHGYSWNVFREDLDAFLLGASGLVQVGALVASGLVVWRFFSSRGSKSADLLAPVIFYLGLLGLLTVAYFSKSQPVLLARYGLIFFALGLPLLAWLLQFLLSRRIPMPVKLVLMIGVVASLGLKINRQLPTLGKVQEDFKAHQQIGIALVEGMRTAGSAARCFSDDVAIRVLSGLPRERFLRTAFVPADAAMNRTAFLEYLRREHAAFLIFFPTEDSLPVKFLPGLFEPQNASRDGFHLVTFANSNFGPDLWLYRVH